jgi:hypothetical protein
MMSYEYVVEGKYIITEITNGEFKINWTVRELTTAYNPMHFIESYRRTKNWFKQNFPEYFL